MVDMKVGAEHLVDLRVADAEREQLVAPALLARKIERRWMALVLDGTGVDQDGVARRADHEGLVGDDHHAERGVEHLRLHAGQMMLENGLVKGREEILRPPPRPLALDHRVDGDVADPDLLHFSFRSRFLRQRSGRHRGVKPGAAMRNVRSRDRASLHPGYGLTALQLRKPGASWPVRATYSE